MAENMQSNDEQILMVTLDQAIQLADFCKETLKLTPGEAFLAILLNQIGDDFSSEKVSKMKAWAHGVIDSIDSCSISSDYIH